MKTLYKRGKNGKVLIWTIQNDDKSYWTTSGQENGTMTTTQPTFVTRKNIGKANETSLEEQVAKEVVSLITYQLEHGYFEEIPAEDFKQFEVTLAAKYGDREKLNKLEFPYICQPKLDGIRCTIQKEGDEITLRSRTHKLFYSVPHLASDPIILSIFTLYPDVILDGELYNHELKSDFNKITSLVKKTKPTQEDLEESKKLIYFNCFDCYFPNQPQLTYTERNIIIGEMIVYHPSYFTDSKIILVDSLNAAKSESCNNLFLNTKEDVENMITNYISMGFEGIMLKKDVPYFFGRTTNLLKYKRFRDEEYTITDIEDGKGNKAGIGVSVVCTVNNTPFKAGINGTEDFARDLFENKEKYIGKKCTVKFQELTPLKDDGTGGVPRFCKMVAIRDYD